MGKIRTRALDIGCGENKVAGAIGIDRIPTKSTDLVADLEAFPWPFKDSIFETIYGHNIVEHVRDIVAFMEEVNRVGVPGAKVLVVTPHYASPSSWEDPTHVRHLALDSFDYFCEQTKHVRHYSRSRFKVVSKRLSFSGSVMGLLGRLIYSISPRAYERKWSFIFRPGTMRIELEVVK